MNFYIYIIQSQIDLTFTRVITRTPPLDLNNTKMGSHILLLKYVAKIFWTIIL